MVMRVISDEINTNGREGHECVPKQYRLNKKNSVTRTYSYQGQIDCGGK